MSNVVLEYNDARFEACREILNFASFSIAKRHLVDLILRERHDIWDRRDTAELECESEGLLMRRVQPQNLVEHILGGSFSSPGRLARTRGEVDDGGRIGVGLRHAQCVGSWNMSLRLSLSVEITLGEGWVENWGGSWE